MTINEISSISSNLISYCKDPKYKACSRPCPCRLWIQCSYYVDKERQLKRLKWKQIHNQTLKEIEEWYIDHFRTHFDTQGDCTNG